MSVKVNKSTNFDRNLNIREIKKQIKKNTFIANEVLRDTANSIAPIDTGQLRNRVTTTEKVTGSIIKSSVEWTQPYSAIRYNVNKKNPQTTEWILKAYKRKKSELQKIQTRDVVK